METNGLDHQGVSLPAPGRVAVPAWFGIRNHFASIEENLTVDAILLVEHKNQTRRLHDLVRKGSFRLPGFADGLTVSSGVKDAVAVQAFLQQFAGPRLQLHLLGFHVSRHINEVARDPKVVSLNCRNMRRNRATIREPDTRQVWLPVTRLRRGRSEIDLTVLSTWNSQIPLCCPLRRDGRGCGQQ